MIVVDTSALIAVLADEPKKPVCLAAMKQAESLRISAGTLHEYLVVVGLRAVSEPAGRLLAYFNVETVALDAELARFAAGVYLRLGKGRHPARLNLADCYSYALARHLACPLLYVGNDFARTDIESALA